MRAFQFVLPLLAVVLLAVGHLAVSGCIIQRREPDCTPDVSCEKCLEISGCGFCDLPDGSCMAGTSLGVDEYGTCPSSAWRFTSCEEPPDVLYCARISSCTECMATEGCGYCADAMECRERDYDQGCVLDIDVESLACREADCQAIVGCDTCALSSGCGFCEESLTCHALDSEIACDLLTDPTSNECKDSNCRIVESCDDCLEHGEGCGWCQETSECRHREASECALELESWSPVCEEARCNEVHSCEDCVAFETESCSWCELWGGFCTRSNDAGDRCPGVYRFTTSCAPPNECVSHNDYGTCIADDRCAWCFGGVSWEHESFSGCVVVDGGGALYAGSCYDLRRTEEERPCAYRITCGYCVESPECAYCTEGNDAGYCVEYSSSEDEPVDSWDCRGWYPPGWNC